MKFDSTIQDYINGKKFSNRLVVPYNYHEVIPSRVKFLTELAKNKKILHLGCLDHLPLIDEKISRGQWLHKTLTESAETCIGIDINEEAKNYVESKYGFSNILLADFTKERVAAVTAQQWDYAILGEILEHIQNPVSYLESIKQNYSGTIKKIVITVPNALNQTVFRLASQSAEIINSDHIYWFTPYTLARVIFHSGMKLDELFFANRVPLTTGGLIKNKFLKVIGKDNRFNFTYASSIIGIASL